MSTVVRAGFLSHSFLLAKAGNNAMMSPLFQPQLSLQQHAGLLRVMQQQRIDGAASHCKVTSFPTAARGGAKDTAMLEPRKRSSEYASHDQLPAGLHPVWRGGGRQRRRTLPKLLYVVGSCQTATKLGSTRGVITVLTSMAPPFSSLAT